MGIYLTHNWSTSDVVFNVLEGRNLYFYNFLRAYPVFIQDNFKDALKLGDLSTKTTNNLQHSYQLWLRENLYSTIEYENRKVLLLGSAKKLRNSAAMYYTAVSQVR